MVGDIPRDNIDDFGRVYYGSDMEYPSVTTVIEQQWESGDDYAWWKQKNNGQGEMPDHEEIKEYSQSRGTLVHYALLNPLTNKELWSDEEEESLESLKEFGTYKYDKKEQRKDAFQRYQRDLQWAKKQFKLIKNNRGINKHNTIEVEQRFLRDEYPRYAGQYDLLYQDPDGNTVLSDIKSSKWIYDKNKLQLAAYAEACNYTVDRLEVLKMHPEYEWCVDADGYQPVEIQTDDEWDKSRTELWCEFESRAEEANEILEQQ